MKDRRFLTWIFFTLFTSRNTDGLSSSELTLTEQLRVQIANSIVKEQRRAKERHPARRELCEGCHRPSVLCVCKALPKEKFKTKTRILILQHPNEFRKKTFSTVPLISLVLENVSVKVGYNFTLESLPIVKDFLGRGKRPLLLFPCDEAISLGNLTEPTYTMESMISEQVFADEISSSDNLLILIDGTWAEAKRIIVQSPELVEQMQRVTFPTDKPSIYDAIRKEPDETCYSTLEACARALALLENATHESTYLENVLELMVNTKIATETCHHGFQRHKARKRAFRRRQKEQVDKALFHMPEPCRIDEIGAVLRPLTVDDARAIHNNLYYTSSKSLRTIKNRLARGLGSFGIECQGKLCAHIVMCEDGCLGMLHVDEEVRERGYAKLLIRQASSMLEMAGLPKMTLIKKGNVPMESLFHSVGWVLADQKTLQHEGYPRRRWIQVASIRSEP